MKKLLILLTVGVTLSGCVTRVIVCSDWNEIKTPDGRVYSERNCRDK
jgi:uncharacterized protein YceK